MIKNVYWSSCKTATRYSCQILVKFEISRQIAKNIQMSNFTKIRPLGAEMFLADRQNVTKLIVVFRNSANAPKKESYIVTGIL
jgi:hypothetical protein